MSEKKESEKQNKQSYEEKNKIKKRQIKLGNQKRK